MVVGTLRVPSPLGVATAHGVCLLLQSDTAPPRRVHHRAGSALIGVIGTGAVFGAGSFGTIGTPGNGSTGAAWRPGAPGSCGTTRPRYARRSMSYSDRPSRGMSQSWVSGGSM